MVTRRSVPITQGGLAALHEELNALLQQRRAAADRIRQVREDSTGSRDEGEGLETLDEQGFIEGRIREIEAILAVADVIDESDVQGSDTVQIGNTVTVRPVPKRTDVVYKIVGPTEADPKNGKVSGESPVGMALLGAKVGDTVEVATPSGARRFKVRDIS